MMNNKKLDELAELLKNDECSLTFKRTDGEIRVICDGLPIHIVPLVCAGVEGLVREGILDKKDLAFIASTMFVIAQEEYGKAAGEA